MDKYARMKTTPSLSLIISLCFLCVRGAFPNPITLNPVPVIDAFPSKTVYRILQDKDGFLWFGTADGLCRYDGYRIMVFRSDLRNPGLLANNGITCLEEDNENNLWIGTKEGLNILNRETFRINQFSNEKLQGLNIQAMLCDSEGNMWIGVDSHIFRYHPKEKILEDMTDKIVDRPFGVNSIFEDSRGDIWILLWKEGLHCYKKDGTVIHYPSIGNHNSPFRIYKDNREQYWICTWGDGMYRFFPDHSEHSMYKEHPVFKKGNVNTEDTFFSIIQDNTLGYIWLMSHSGIYALKYNKSNLLESVDVSHLFENTNNIFSEFQKDLKGNLWIAAYDEGVFSINFDRPLINNLSLKDIKNRLGVVPNITVVYKDDDSVLWANQNRIGLTLYDMKTDRVKTYKDFDKLKNIDFLDNISCIQSFDNNEVWIGAASESKIAVVQKREKEIHLKSIIDLDKLHHKTNGFGMKKIFRDHQKNVWIIDRQYLFVKPHHKNEISIFPHELISITDIAEDLNGDIWVSSKKGLYRISCNFLKEVPDIKIIHYDKNAGLTGEHILTICSDREGNMWFGTKEGHILLFNNRESRFEDRTNEFNMPGESIQDMFADNRNNIWITTNKQVVGYNKTAKYLRGYSIDEDDLIVNSFRPGSYYIDNKNDLLYLGGNRGICVFSSSDFNAKPDKNIQVIVSDVRVNGRSLLSSPGNNKFKVISRKLSLSSDDRNIELDFTTLDYTYPGKIIYAYKMEGMDNDWVYTNRRFAFYNQLKKGKYMLRVKATDENRMEYGDPVSFEIYRAPAFYETRGAYLLYFVVVLIVIYRTYRIIHNRIKLQQELRIAQIERDKSEELVQVKLKYFTNISHDLLTPLAVISCLIDDIEMLFKPKIRQLGMMRANITRLRRLLQQVLDFRKMESGNMKLRITRGDISTFIKNIYAHNFIPLFEKKNIRFLFHSEPTFIEGYFDADKIDKIIYNLLSNALKYTPEGGIIQIRLQVTERNDSNFLSVAVADTGVGIPPEHMDDIFIRFYNNRNIDTGQTNGIGLSLTRDLVELHRGRITVESKENEGSTFTVLIPINKSAFEETELDNYLIEKGSDRENDEKEAEWTVSEDFAPKEDFTVLLVEDNEDILYTVENILQKRYNVQTAVNGAIALNMVKDKEIDIIISDVMMPQMDGLELCRNIKSNINTSHIPVLLLTAKSSVEDRIDCYDAGADGYISKPFDTKLLIARINNFLANRRKKQDEFKSNAEINISVLEYPSPDENFLNRAVSIIESHLDDTNLDLDLFAEQMNMSKSSLYRKIKVMTNLSPNDFIRNIRLKHACQMLREKSISISDVAYATGFADQRYFSKCFKSAFGVTPSEYQKNNNTST